jgi:polyisoprenoid-binding protein YceI
MRRLIPVVALLAGLMTAMTPTAAQAATPPEVVHQQVVFTGADLGVVNICGDLADFRFSGEFSFTFVGMSDDVFHFQSRSIGTYTVTFLDPSKGVWEARFREVDTVQATAGGTFTTVSVDNAFEGPVRIHELTTFVVGPDGTIRVDRYTIDFVAARPASVRR